MAIQLVSLQLLANLSYLASLQLLANLSYLASLQLLANLSYLASLQLLANLSWDINIELLFYLKCTRSSAPTINPHIKRSAESFLVVSPPSRRFLLWTLYGDWHLSIHMLTTRALQNKLKHTCHSIIAPTLLTSSEQCGCDN
jgi:hypothetical protein